MPRPTTHRILVDGHELQLSNLAKVMYPRTGFTKADVIDYYVQAAPVLLPHLRLRPLSLKRYPDGVEAPFFYQKECPGHRPPWLETAKVFSPSRGRDIEYCVGNDRASLVWLANTGDLELHTYLHRARDPDAPTAMVFDLDPGPGCDVLSAAAVGLMVRRRLGDAGLHGFPKVSGGKGLQVYVPLNPGSEYVRSKSYSRALAESLEKEFPADVTSNMRKSLRAGRVLVDWSQNDRHKTTVCVYSLRGQPTPTVSAPLQWPEVEKAVADGDRDALRFTPAEALARVARHGDLFSDVLTMRQRLPRLGASAA